MSFGTGMHVLGTGMHILGTGMHVLGTGSVDVICGSMVAELVWVVEAVQLWLALEKHLPSPRLVPIRDGFGHRRQTTFEDTWARWRVDGCWLFKALTSSLCSLSCLRTSKNAESPMLVIRSFTSSGLPTSSRLNAADETCSKTVMADIVMAQTRPAAKQLWPI